MAQDFEPLSEGSENEQETGEPYIVTMSDEDGCEHSFELVDSMEKMTVSSTPRSSPCTTSPRRCWRATASWSS